MQKRQNGEKRMGLRELRECFEEFSYTSGSAAQALKEIAKRLRQMTIDEQSVEYEHTLVEKEPWKHMEISREEVTWLNKELPEWSKEYNEDIAGRKNDKPYYF